MQRNVIRVMTDVDGKAAVEAGRGQKCTMKREEVVKTLDYLTVHCGSFFFVELY